MIILMYRVLHVASNNASTLDSLVLDELCRETRESAQRYAGRRARRTLDLGDGAREDVLLGLGVREALHDAVDDGLDEVGLLALLGLLLEADPAVKDGLDLGRERDLLALNECLRLELCGLLLGRNTLASW